METSLHRQLKALYADCRGARQEVSVDCYRIDVVRGRRLFEIQHGPLAALREKVRRLTAAHDLTIVKPLVARKTILRRSREGGPVVSRRQSPKRRGPLDIFEELVYLTGVFPHPRLSIEVLVVEIEEYRYPGHGRRRRWRERDHIVEDQHLVSVGEAVRLTTVADLVGLLPAPLPKSFHTGELAELAGVSRHRAQQIAYCLRKAGGIVEIGKRRNSILYQPAPPEAPAPRRRRRKAA